MKIIFTLLIISICSLTYSQNKLDSKGLKQGRWTKPYKNTAMIHYSGQFNDDTPYGDFIYYYKSGNMQSKMRFSDNGITAYSLMYHESSGYMMARGKYSNQQKDSLWVYYDNQGQLKSQESYKDGKLNGQRVIYYEPVNGQYRVARYEYYTDGILDGQFKEYYPNTKIKLEGTYKDGNFHGIVRYYYGNGKKERIEKYQYAVKHGWWVFFDEKGVVVGKELFWEGVKLKGAAKEKRALELKNGNN
tara:strand:+ start:1064 stop:1798 length:735 start_codon:yes stop_codon:yes gene_type:complete